MTTKERRKHGRVKTLNLVSFVCIDDKGNELDQGMGEAISISRGGICLETQIPIELQQILLLAVGFENELIEFKGEIIYCREQKDGIFNTGVQFLETTEKIDSIVISLIKDFSKQKPGDAMEEKA